mmetsp:Transcript_10613/g.16084  ORF Transcript_10613/g.16084 Transcript_10613/m.16084 type:complete len:900 (+) Transcript_10613:108-2807(+)|eukprot:CAMPEP_0185035514 /NCGR_PEP_ID=MMETSP1103-20130426/27043_1 /TAXON_ID=36769 /ORGANISM="Paraphysomonas bandaiensis, Strain Caron Lab Isolate" /LENGTH=899 /DNA_ID=CAMNT_0027572633 /DNA_START=44 /DNA_END=2743 /DNA_ORIENTATION=-
MESEDVPLLDEINELLVKERTLMGLKVIEQHVEAEEWKQKYETLVNEISKNSKGFENVSAYELAADIASAKSNWHGDVDRILHTQPTSQYPWCLDLSGISLDSIHLKKILNFPKSHNYDGVSVLRLHNCELNDGDAELLVSLLSLRQLECLDLSHNNLGRRYQELLLRSMEKRRLKLQYLLLHGNMPLSECSLENMLHHLSSHTWGLTVTLADFTSDMSKHKGRPTSVSRSKKSGSQRNDDVKDSSVHPYLCTRFLKHLNYVLGPHDTHKRNRNAKSVENISKAQKSKKSAAEPEKEVVPQVHRGAGGTAGGPQLMSVLGLSHAALCRESIKQLKVTLDITVGSLTDLDLSHSFIGIRGAEMIGQALMHPVCQLIRLNLAGNAIGDRGVSQGLVNSLKSSLTLTYLNVQSNDITNTGVIALSMCLLRKQTLRKLLVEGNPISRDVALECQRNLVRSGAQVLLLWTSELTIVSSETTESQGSILSKTEMCNNGAAPTQSDSILSCLFALPGQVTVPIDTITRSALLYSVSSRHFRPFSRQFTDMKDTETSSPMELGGADESGTVVIRWNMGLGEQGSRSDRSKCRLSWEVRCRDAQSRVLASQPLLPGACLPPGKRTRCSVTIPCPPMQSIIEVWVHVVSSDTLIGSSADGSGLVVEGSRFEALRSHVHSLKPSHDNEQGAADARMVFAGGDSLMWSGNCNRLLSERVGLEDTNAAQGIPEGYNIDRKFQWVGQPSATCSIRFKARLTATWKVGTHGASSSGWRMTNGDTIGYRWSVLRCRHGSGEYEEVGFGSIDTADDEEGTQQEQVVTRLLAPWTWREWSVEVDNLGMNDFFLLCSCLKNPSESKELAERCSVGIQECGIFLPADSYVGWEGLMSEGTMNPTVVYSSFNDQGLQIAL